MSNSICSKCGFDLFVTYHSTVRWNPPSGRSSSSNFGMDQSFGAPIHSGVEMSESWTGINYWFAYCNVCDPGSISRYFQIFPDRPILANLREPNLQPPWLSHTQSSCLGASHYPGAPRSPGSSVEQKKIHWEKPTFLVDSCLYMLIQSLSWNKNTPGSIQNYTQHLDYRFNGLECRSHSSLSVECLPLHKHHRLGCAMVHWTFAPGSTFWLYTCG